MFFNTRVIVSSMRRMWREVCMCLAICSQSKVTFQVIYLLMVHEYVLMSANDWQEEMLSQVIRRVNSRVHMYNRCLENVRGHLRYRTSTVYTYINKDITRIMYKRSYISTHTYELPFH